MTALIEAADGDIWIGTSRGVSHLHDGHFLSDTVVRALSEEKIWSLYEDKDHAIWIGTSNGLYRLLHNTLVRYSTAQGLPENVIYQILDDSSDALWLSSPGSVARVDRRMLMAQKDPGHHAPLSVTLYPIAHDFGSAVLYSGMQPAGILDAHGNAWFPSSRGVVRIEAPHATGGASARFPVVVDDVSVDGQTRPPAAKIKLAPGTARVEVAFSAILLGSQQGLRYRYRLQGFDHAWNDATSSHLASYTNLHPGAYRLRVQAYEAGDPAVVAESSLILIQKPHFYKTEWFALLCATALLLLLAAAHWLRVRQVAMRFRAVLEERNRLAREMHDTLIQDCAGVSALLEAVSKLDFEDRTLCHELIDHARQQVSATIDETRNAVWNLRHSSPQGETLAVQGAIEETARQFQNRFGLPVHCVVEGGPFPLPAAAAHELMMIVREAIANAAQHAQASQIHVRLQFAANGLDVTLEDDGIGFAPSLAAAPEDEIHYGLRGMQERAERLGGTFSLLSSPGKGTRIDVRLPRRLRNESRSA